MHSKGGKGGALPDVLAILRRFLGECASQPCGEARERLVQALEMHTGDPHALHTIDSGAANSGLGSWSTWRSKVENHRAAIQSCGSTGYSASWNGAHALRVRLPGRRRSGIRDERSGRARFLS